MKNTFWVILGIIALVSIIWLVARTIRVKNVNVGADGQASNREVIVALKGQGLNPCPKGTFTCSRDPYKCCVEEASGARTTAEEFCKKHGGTWNPFTQKCIAFTEPDVQRAGPRIVTVVSNGGNGVNPAGA